MPWPVSELSACLRLVNWHTSLGGHMRLVCLTSAPWQETGRVYPRRETGKTYVFGVSVNGITEFGGYGGVLNTYHARLYYLILARFDCT